MSKLSIFPEMVLWQQQLQNFYVCMHHGPTELDDKLRAFQELSCQLWIWRTIFLAEGIRKVHIFRHLFVCFQTSVYTLGEFLRFASPVKLHLRPSNPQLTPPTLQMQYCYSLIVTIAIIKSGFYNDSDCCYNLPRY